MLYSGILSVLTSSTQIALCNVGQELNVFGMIFSNPTTTERVITLSLYRQAIGSAQTMAIIVPAKTKLPWDKAVSLQPGDHLDVVGDAAGVGLLWSLDVDTGAIPVATGFNIRGVYSNVASYAACDIVLKSGSSYVAIRDNTNKDPGTQTADWMLLLDGSGTQNAVDVIVAGAPSVLDTLSKIASAIGNDANFGATIATALAQKASTSSLASVAFSGNFSDLGGIKKLASRRAFMTRDLV